MSGQARVVALDGHDGAGKTTIATALADALDGVYVRPFGGATGRALMAAATAHDPVQVLAVGEGALRDALGAHRDSPVVVLDRSWMTVASLVEPAEFAAAWTLWVPTVLCWSDLTTTLQRLAVRTEEPEDTSWHSFYLDRYLELARRFDVPVVRTDRASVASCVDAVRAILDGLSDTAP